MNPRSSPTASTWPPAASPVRSRARAASWTRSRRAEAAVPLTDRLEDLRSLDVVAAFLAAVDELAAGVDLAGRNCPRAPSWRCCALPPGGRAGGRPRPRLLLDLLADGCSSCRTAGRACRTRRTPTGATSWPPSSWPRSSPGAGRLPVAGRDRRGPVRRHQRCPATDDGRGGPRYLEESEEGDEAPAALAVVRRLVDLGVLSPVEPWTARPGTAGAVLDVVDGFFRSESEQEPAQD